ncbi:type II toxin-antitoxin system YoeB family toxin [Hoylesella saccharolytica]|uniref:type II toxin-antitoxin system YoeB family toxin n=1 Tax=Hoylesella saccharolytica TaxID=633701 RepID=UPI0028F146F0|nr:type II toxin-antitoxin system YoeB family toxin [Hoylesella saccharolytica]
MSYKVEVSKDADKVIRKWKKSNPQLFNKYRSIFHELVDHPKTGTGHPEPMKEGNGITYSRRVTAHDRIVYDIYEDVITVLIIEVEGHYSDK